jgi:hypothetical protein
VCVCVCVFVCVCVCVCVYIYIYDVEGQTDRPQLACLTEKMCVYIYQAAALGLYIHTSLNRAFIEP